MDAYIFAVEATQQAIDAAIAAVSAGTARAALPLLGARRLYVAVADADAAALFAKVAEIAAIPGLVGVVTNLASDPPSPPTKSFPTHGVVGDYIGFCLIRPLPGATLSVYTSVQGIEGVVGAAIVTGEAGSVLVEVTADDTATVASIQNDVEATVGVALVSTATGVTALGAGFTTA